MKEQVNRSDFSEAAYSYLYDNFISYGASSGFSADVMTAALSRDQITADMRIPSPVCTRATPPLIPATRF